MVNYMNPHCLNGGLNARVKVKLLNKEASPLFFPFKVPACFLFLGHHVCFLGVEGHQREKRRPFSWLPVR